MVIWRVVAATLLLSAARAYELPRIAMRPRDSSRLLVPAFSACADLSRARSPSAVIVEDENDTVALTDDDDKRLQLLVEQEPSISMTLADEVLSTLAVVVVVLGWLFWTLLRSDLVDAMDTMPLEQRLAVLRTVSWFPASGSGDINYAEIVFSLVMAASAFAQALTGFGVLLHAPQH